MKIQDVSIGYQFEHGIKGKGIVTGKTKRTITVAFAKSTVKVTYRSNDAYFSIADF